MMRQSDSVVQHGIRGGSVSARKRFKRYNSERELPMKDPHVREDEQVRQLIRIFERCKGNARSALSVNDIAYNIMRSEDIHFSSADIERFSLAMAELDTFHSFPTFMGTFLSSVILYGSSDNEYLIHTHHVRPLDNLAFGLWGKKLIVNGDVGAFAGSDMSNPYDTDGECKPGILVINGDADHSLGLDMDGGEIHVSGNIRMIGTFTSGKIFHRGKLIIDK
jgi:hypothetical protein